MEPTGGHDAWDRVEVAAAWLLALLWLLPLAYALWSAFHPPAYVTRFDLLAPLTLRNFEAAWSRAPFARYYLNSVLLVTSVLAAQFVLCTLAGYAFSRFASDVEPSPSRSSSPGPVKG